MASEEVCIAKNAVPKAQSVRSPQQPQETKEPKDIPPEAVKENMDAKDGLVELAQPAMGEPGGEREEDGMEAQQEENWLFLDPDILSYIDMLLSQDDLVNRVEEVIQSRFVAQLLSSDSQLDLSALTNELLELEEGLALIWLLEKLHLYEEEEEEEEDEQAPQSDGALQCDPSPSESVASQDAQRDDHGPQLEVNGKACPPETDIKDDQRPGHADVHLSSLQAFAAPSGCLECPPLGAICPPSSPQSPRRTDSDLGPRDATIPREVSPVRGNGGPVDRSSEKEGDLPSLASPKSLSPSARSLSPDPASGLACPEGQGPRKAARSQAPKRKSEQSVAGRGRKRKRYCSQRGAVGGPSCPQSGDPN
ncbi:NUT family member 2D-like [Myotis lucifugus]|uniref:NUT family member 2D-like n=1 Tax=Myotis lucifugus TaxID=59463 RepID=UPI000CCC3FF3|nr:NUT family member 2D-like [Myotis lucifugus]